MIDRLTSFALLAFVLLSTNIVQASKTVVWRQATKEDFNKGERTGCSFGANGELRLAAKVRLVADLQAASVWKMVRTPQGKVFLATSEPSQVIQMAPDGQRTVLWQSETAKVFSLLPLADGSLLVGTGPSAKIIRINPQGQASDFCQLDASYIWDMKASSTGRIFAATGPKGLIYAIDAQGKAQTFYDTQQEHAMSLAVAADDSLVCGTSSPGLVLTISADAKGRALCDAGGADVCDLLLDDGVIYAGTCAASAKTPGSSSSSSKPNLTSSLWRMDEAGNVRSLVTLPASIYSLALSGKGTSRELLAGTGSQGILYSIEPNSGEHREITRLEAEQIMSIASEANGKLLLATANPAKVWSVSGELEAKGTFISDMLDAKQVAYFGSVQWSASTPAGTTLTVAVRSGNTALPGELWSRWSDEMKDGEGTATCPPGRFFQYRVTLGTSQPHHSPELRSIAIRYRTSNVAPNITKLTVPHVDESDGKKLLSKWKLTWAATDSNQDELTYSLHLRKSEWQQWVLLNDKLTTAEYEWDVTSIPEGHYQLKLTADDSASNPADDTLSTSQISETFLVDGRPPVVSVKLAAVGPAAPPSFEAEAHDAMTPIVAASYSVDSGDWINLFPQDRLFDSLTEKFRFSPASLSPGLHILMFKATDAAGFTSSTDTVFTVPK